MCPSPASKPAQTPKGSKPTQLRSSPHHTKPWQDPCVPLPCQRNDLIPTLHCDLDPLHRVLFPERAELWTGTSSTIHVIHTRVCKHRQILQTFDLVTHRIRSYSSNGKALASSMPRRSAQLLLSFILCRQQNGPNATNPGSVDRGGSPRRRSSRWKLPEPRALHEVMNIQSFPI